MKKIKGFTAEGIEVEIDIPEGLIIKSQTEIDALAQSANSKGKGEILKTLGVNSVEEARTKMGAITEVQELSSIVKELRSELEAETHRRLALELNIKPELVDKAIILAKASATEGSDFRSVLEIEAKAIGAIKSATPATPAKPIGAPKSGERTPLSKADEEEMERFRSLDPQGRR